MERIRRFLNNNIFIFSVRQGLLLTIPFLIMGSFSLVIMHFPVPMWQSYLVSIAGGTAHTLLMGIYQATLGSLAFIFAIMIAYAYGEEQKIYGEPMCFSRQFPCVPLLRSAIHPEGLISGDRSGVLPHCASLLSAVIF